MDTAITEHVQEKRDEIEQRREEAGWTVAGYQRDGGDDDDLTAVQDIISNLLHFAREKGMQDPANICRAAIANFEAEEVEAEIN